MVEITILGGRNCRKIMRFEKRLKKVAGELNIDLSITRKTTLPEFLNFDTYLLPTTLFNNKMIRGRLPKNRELKQLLLKYKKEENIKKPKI